jgi:ubiquinone/menaquinone biosynthesis C-methylase UbiE
VQSILSDFTAAIASRMPLAGARILDVGCGDGAFVRELARAGARVTGVECSEAQLALCRQAPPVGGEQYLYGVGQSLPFDTGVFDATVFRASLHHVPAREMEQALREARRVTRPTGELYVFEPLTSGTHFELTRLVDDETTVRAQAQAAIARAVAAGWLSRRHAQTLVADVVYESVDALRRRIVAIDASRTAIFAAVEPELRRAFESSGDPCEGGRRFTQPFRLDVLF